MIDVLLVAPYASIRAGLRVMLAPVTEISIAGEARDAATLGYLLRAGQPDVVVYDASTDDLDSVLSLIEEAVLPIVALSDDPVDVALLVTRRHAAWCALARAAGPEELAAGIRAAASGLIAVDPSHAEAVSLADSLAHPAVDAGDGEEPALTPREREVLQLMTQGLANKNIAARLKISLSTAKFHVASVLAKLDASSRTEAVTIGARRGLVSL